MTKKRTLDPEMIDSVAQNMFYALPLIKKRLPDKIISDIIELQRQYRCLLWGIETVQFQEFLKTLIKFNSDDNINRSALKPISILPFKFSLSIAFIITKICTLIPLKNSKSIN